jgi:CheY-like chemotaxis protein
MAHGSVLLVSHRGPMRRLLQRLLTQEGYPVQLAASNVAALQTLRRAAPERRSVVLYEATTRWALAHAAPRFFAVVARHTTVQQHRFVLLTAEVQELPDELCELLVPLAERVQSIAFEIEPLLDALDAASTAAPVGWSDQAGVEPAQARGL